LVESIGIASGSGAGPARELCDFCFEDEVVERDIYTILYRLSKYVLVYIILHIILYHIQFYIIIIS